MARKEDISVEIGMMAVKKSDLEVKLNTLPSVMTKGTTEFFKKPSGFTTNTAGEGRGVCQD